MDAKDEELRQSMMDDMYASPTADMAMTIRVGVAELARHLAEKAALAKQVTELQTRMSEMAMERQAGGDVVLQDLKWDGKSVTFKVGVERSAPKGPCVNGGEHEWNHSPGLDTHATACRRCPARRPSESLPGDLSIEVVGGSFKIRCLTSGRYTMVAANRFAQDPNAPHVPHHDSPLDSSVVAATHHDSKGSLSLLHLQDSHAAWMHCNFPKQEVEDSVLGIVEEIGELARALLKRRNSIRGTPEQWDAKAKDAVADIIIFLFGYCTLRGWCFNDILRDTWLEVKQRDWVSYPETGKPPTKPPIKASEYKSWP